MAQNKKPKQGKRAPGYSADGMVVSLIVGLILIALGVLIFLAVALGLEGDIFTLLRTLSSGLSGTLAIALPVIPVWGGVLIIMTTQRKAPKRAFVLSCVLLLLIMTAVTLFTCYSLERNLFFYIFHPSALESDCLMRSIQGELNKSGIQTGYTSFLSRGYTRGNMSVGGGFLGMLLAWPLWSLFGAYGGLMITILMTLVVFCFLTRLDVKGIAARMKQSSADHRARREQQLLQQREQELLWQQEQALQQEQLRRQQEMLRQQQMQAAQQRMQQQPVQPEPADPWSSMMPAGTANWNQTQGNMQPPLVQKVEPASRGKARKKPAKPQVGFQPTPEELGQMTAPQAMPDAQLEPARGKKGLFRRDRDEDAADDVPHRRGLFGRDDAEEETLPGEAPQPQRPATNRRPPAAKPIKPITNRKPVNIAQPIPEEHDPWAASEDVYTPDEPIEPVKPLTPEMPAQEPAAQEAPVHPSQWRTATAPQPVAKAEPRASAFQRPAPAAEPEEPEFDAQEPAAGPLASETPVREGSFMARLRAAQAAANGQKPAETAAEPAAQPAPRKSRKDTPSAWSQPDNGAGSASWRTGEEPQRPARPAARNAAQPAKPAPKPAASWEDTPPWEDFAEPEAAQPAAAVTPVLSRETPQDSMWQPEIKTPPRRSMASMPDGALMETEEEKPYVFPPMNLLKDPDPQKGISEEEDALRSRRLENTLQSFRVPAKVRHITHGPAISRFELELAPGVKVSKVTDLNRNIAMNMEVKSVRIEAPIPGKSLVGVEVPNRERATVTLREVLESEPMRKATKPLVVALGKDIAGTPIVCDLAKMPHLLIAGATGSGKSVCINTIINSLLYRCSPKEVRLILVDPKVVELQCYNGIPHLLVPVVSDPHKASGALAWAVGEMMDRYKRFQEAGVRAIDGYNEQMPEDEKMPRIVIVIDELADLMMTCKKDVEERICRLAQLARAAGIHLIVATQRPSVDVITGLIKANIPSRIAFKVSSNVDSRTILDRIGAEQLLGYGDMLYMPTGEFTPIRVQGCFLSDPEVNRITDFIRESCPASYDPAVLEELEKLQSDSDTVVVPDSSSNDDYTGGDGSLLAQCIEMAVNDGQVSTSLIQRRLKLGYARAGRLVDEMEKRGIVSQKDGAKPRMCLISREEFETMKDTGVLD